MGRRTSPVFYFLTGRIFFNSLRGLKKRFRIFISISAQDPRHYNLVELLCDYAPSRRFGKVGMELFDLREHDREEVLQAVMDRGRQNISSPMMTGRCNFSDTFVEKPQKKRTILRFLPQIVGFFPDKETFYPDTPIIDNTEGCSFAFQPIVDPFRLRNYFVGSAVAYTGRAIPRRLFCRADRGRYFISPTCTVNGWALSLAGKLGLRNKALSINLLPMTMVKRRMRWLSCSTKLVAMTLFRSRLLSSSLSGK